MAKMNEASTVIVLHTTQRWKLKGKEPCIAICSCGWRPLDVTIYPTKELSLSNERHRAIGVGVQGLADLFIALRIPFESKQARDLNVSIAESIYYAALESSSDLAAEQGVYKSYFDSPISHRIFQFDLWGITPSRSFLDWEMLRIKIRKTGLRNSLLVAYMPTAGTSQITGCSEGIEPITRCVNTADTYWLCSDIHVHPQ